MKIKLNGLDRLIIPEILPKTGGRLEQIVVKEINEITQIKSEEFKDFGLVELGEGRISWDVEKIKIEKEFDLKKPHTDLLKEAVKKLDEAKGWDQRNIETCLKIEKFR